MDMWNEFKRVWETSCVRYTLHQTTWIYSNYIGWMYTQHTVADPATAQWMWLLLTPFLRKSQWKLPRFFLWPHNICYRCWGKVAGKWYNQFGDPVNKAFVKHNQTMALGGKKNNRLKSSLNRPEWETWMLYIIRTMELHRNTVYEWVAFMKTFRKGFSMCTCYSMCPFAHNDQVHAVWHYINL